MGASEEPISLSTLSSHFKAPWRWISTQHGVLVIAWRWYPAPQPYRRDRQMGKDETIVATFFILFRKTLPWFELKTSINFPLRSEVLTRRRIVDRVRMHLIKICGLGANHLISISSTTQSILQQRTIKETESNMELHLPDLQFINWFFHLG